MAQTTGIARQPLSEDLARTLRETAHALADAARPETLRHFRQPLDVSNKLAAGGFDPVTVADRAAEQAMRGLLRDLRPDDAILGEEFGAQTGTSGLTWILDPIDGTRGYISGAPTWGVLISVSDAAGPLFGIIDQPYIGERFAGGTGGMFGPAEATGPLGTVLLAVRGVAGLAQATLLSTFPEVGTMAERAAFQRVTAQVRLTRYGMDCYGYALLAAGQVDLVIEAGLQAYDVCAPIAVIEAAGGIVTDWQGGAAHEGGQILAAATRALHDAAMERLNAG